MRGAGTAVAAEAHTQATIELALAAAVLVTLGLLVLMWSLVIIFLLTDTLLKLLL